VMGSPSSSGSCRGALVELGAASGAGTVGLMQASCSGPICTYPAWVSLMRLV
jgi:hypothetical protein